MGEMADMALEHLYDEDDDPDRDQDNNYRTPRGPLIKTCKFCGEKGLVWKEDKPGKWRLVKNGVIHTCGKKNK
mgnify:CR=1 FL=1